MSRAGSTEIIEPLVPTNFAPNNVYSPICAPTSITVSPSLIFCENSRFTSFSRSFPNTKSHVKGFDNSK